ncbi:MAG: hypothetical protein CMH83_08120 [Nocardioides sp.]|nr:hypothetical protein [Nocardioides sp.]
MHTGSLGAVVTLLLVTGSGRSGTSSVAGSLKRLGFHVPQPENPPDERNPRGYYEPQWVSQFHLQWLNGIPVRTIDPRPDAGAVAMATATPERREALRTWLAEELAQHGPDDVVVVKETRAYWVYPLWRDVAEELGARLVSLTMLRHPTQVVRSRDAAYLSHRPDAVRLQRETANTAAWVNSVVVTERQSRTNPRAFVPYVELIDDWRTTLFRACRQLDVDPGRFDAPHPVDDFLTAELNRSDDTWNGLTVPDEVRDLAERTWTAARALAVDPDDAVARTALDVIGEEYVTLHAFAAAVATDDTLAKVAAERQRLQRRLDTKNHRIAGLRSRVAELEAELGIEPEPDA